MNYSPLALLTGRLAVTFWGASTEWLHAFLVIIKKEMLESLPWRTITHYGLHFVAPLLLTLLFKKDHRVKAYLIMLVTMIVDADHLLANPIFDPNRMSIGFHPLHSYFAIAIYVIMCILPYEKLHWPWWLRAVGIGLVFHMITDWQDYVLWL